jgi:hypothetical protein
MNAFLGLSMSHTECGFGNFGTLFGDRLTLESLNFKSEGRQIKFSSGYPFGKEGVQSLLEFGEGACQG